MKEVLLTILMLNGIITVTEPGTPLNDADHVGSFFYYITNLNELIG